MESVIGMKCSSLPRSGNHRISSFTNSLSFLADSAAGSILKSW